MEKSYLKNSSFIQPNLANLENASHQNSGPNTRNCAFDMPKFKTNFNFPFGKKTPKKGDSLLLFWFAFVCLACFVGFLVFNVWI